MFVFFSVQAKANHNLLTVAVNQTVEGLVSPITKSASASFDVENSSTSSTTTTSATVSASAADRRWRQRACSIVREESEDDISVHLRSSRSASPVHGSPLISPSPVGFGISGKHYTTHALTVSTLFL